MRRNGRVLILLTLMVACARQIPPHSLDNQYRYTCCNLRYERERVTERNLQQGSLLPAGTPVRIDEVRRNLVMFKPEGAPILMLIFVGREGYSSMDEYLESLFVAHDPRPSIARLPRAVRSAIAQAQVLPGMSREQVLMALGHPPTQLTPTLTGPNWRYYLTRREVLEVFFENDAVVRVSQQPDALW